MRRRRVRLLTVSSAVAVLTPLAFLVAREQMWLRLPLGLPLVMLLPGYGIVSALFPGDTFGRLERAVLAGGVSVASTIAVGLVLASTRPGLDPATWVVSLATLTLAADAVAVYRVSSEPAALPDDPPLMPPMGLTVLGIVAAASLVLLVVVSAANPIRPSSGEIVQLWALRSQTSTDTVNVGVSNLLSPTALFRLQVFQGDKVLVERSLDLPAGTSTSLVVHPSAAPSRLTPMTAVLTAVGPTMTERTVTIWPSDAATETTAAR